MITSPQSSSPRPNLLFLFSDQQHWEAPGCMNPFFDTPNLDAFAKEGVLFERSFCTTPQCSHSRSTMLTGFYATENAIGYLENQPFADNPFTLFVSINDPHELINAASDPLHTGVVQELSRKLDTWMQEHGDSMDGFPLTDRKGNSLEY